VTLRSISNSFSLLLPTISWLVVVPCRSRRGGSSNWGSIFYSSFTLIMNLSFTFSSCSLRSFCFCTRENLANIAPMAASSVVITAVIIISPVVLKNTPLSGSVVAVAVAVSVVIIDVIVCFVNVLRTVVVCSGITTMLIGVLLVFFVCLQGLLLNRRRLFSIVG
jgi:hypothetical protein